MHKPFMTPSSPYRIIGIYILVAVFSVVFSDHILASFVEETIILEQYRFYKDWIFILLTTAALYIYIHRHHTLVQHSDAAIRNSEQRYRDVAESASDWIWEMDANLRLSYLSDRFYLLTGISPKQILGHTRWELAANGPDSEKWRQHRQMLEEHRPFRDFSYRIILADQQGQAHYFKISGKPIYDQRGRFQGYRGMGTDITEQKRAEEEAARMRLYLKNIIDAMPSVLLGVDVTGRITEWNRQAEKMSGLSREQAQGRHFTEVFPQLQIEQEQLQTAIQTRRPIKPRRLTLNIEDSIHYIDVMVYPLIADSAIGAVIRLDDVTARVRIEEMMMEAEKMLSVGELAAGMAHEINNPLGAILQGSQNIMRRLSPDLPKNRRVAESLGLDLEQVTRYLEERSILQFLEGIREAGSRAAKIVTDMLAFSRRSEYQFIHVDLEELLDTVVRLATNDYDLKKKYDFKQIQIERDYDPDLRLIYCDKTEIEQVLLNLIKNAAQAMASHRSPNPTITLRTRRESRHACIEVRDNGPGLDEQTRKRVFEPFFTTKEVGVGTGLGLSVSYFIVTEQHKGSLSVISQPDQGACFTVRLPLEE